MTSLSPYSERSTRAARPTVARQWHVTGQVQGVGFRPHVYRIATHVGICGYVRNDSRGVLIHGQAHAPRLDQFADELIRELPPMARIDTLAVATAPVDRSLAGFQIVASRSDHIADAQITIDTAVCDECKAELFDPADPRYRYGLINCTHCGPRYSIIQSVPYDRPHTTMSGFDLCPACAEQYADPADRRFHAQPVACPHCGPTVSLVDSHGDPIAGDPYKQAAAELEAGRIIAIKGLGGYHLAVRADDPAAVQRLRDRKHRDAKPFALMCRNVDVAKSLTLLSERAEQEMRSPACPIVLGVRHDHAAIADAVAPGNHRLGVMLPYTPMQHLLFSETSLDALVMTSANDSDDPLVTDNAEALARLGHMCDAMLWHDRPIARAVDDSVLIDTAATPLPIRRARGYAPTTITLPASSSEPGMCVGGELKNTIALVRGNQAILSPHIGDLTHPKAYEQFQRTVADLCKLFGVVPRWVAHDLHPTYMCTRFALKYAAEHEIESIGVQHHFAHAASLLAEHQRSDSALFITADGVGYGTDRTMWGGEILLAGLTGYTRLARLTPLQLPGGDAAARETRRCGLAALKHAMGDAYATHPLAERLAPNNYERTLLTTMLNNGVNCATSSAAGRWFDAIAAILGLAERNSFEAQAGMALEAAAFNAGPIDVTRPLFEIKPDSTDEALMQIDLAPLVRTLADRAVRGECQNTSAAIFHAQLAWAFAEAIAMTTQTHGVDHVGLSGGVFANQLLTDQLAARLAAMKLTVLRHQLVPAGDGGLSLGQAAHVSAIKEAHPCV